MWRETDSWYKIQFSDSTFGYIHMDTYGNPVGVYTEAGDLISSDAKVEYTCIDDNAPVPSWYVPPTV